MDETTNEPLKFNVVGKLHDVSRSMGMVFGVDVDGKRIWGAEIVGKS